MDSGMVLGYTIVGVADKVDFDRDIQQVVPAVEGAEDANIVVAGHNRQVLATSNLGWHQVATQADRVRLHRQQRVLKQAAY